MFSRLGFILAFLLALAAVCSPVRAFADQNVNSLTDLPGCLRKNLGELLARNTDRAAEPEFLKRMSAENPDWVLETVRTQAEASAAKLSDPAFRSYLDKVQDATRAFDRDFRAGQVSSRIYEVLRDQHRRLVLGKEGSISYAGTTAKVGQDTAQNVLQNAGRFGHESNHLIIRSATIDLRRRPGYGAKGPWNGPGEKMAPPPDLPGPFPETHGESWNLWFPEIAEKAVAKGMNPHKDVMPKNYNAYGAIRHEYPRFYNQKIYIDRMGEIMREIEIRLLGDNPATHSAEVLKLVADYYQIGINAHLFERVNHSLLMNQVNYLLHYMGYRGVPHGALDYYALYKVPEDFRRIFMNAVAERNPGF